MKVKFISTVLMLCFSFSFGESRQQKLLRLKKESNDNYKYLGQLSKNSFSTDSTSNKYGRYGSKYSTDSINNKYGNYGSKYSPNSVNNPYAIGIRDRFWVVFV